eukprot:scaffold2088_cov399-Prasinococcus_capsulatus_cf.AAC.6
MRAGARRTGRGAPRGLLCCSEWYKKHTEVLVAAHSRPEAFEARGGRLPAARRGHVPLADDTRVAICGRIALMAPV